jgi:hypothetical protein
MYDYIDRARGVIPYDAPFGECENEQTLQRVVTNGASKHMPSTLA